MASRAEKIDRFPNKIIINISEIQNLKSPKAEPLTIFLRFEYNDGQFSESGKFDITDGSPRQVDHNAVLGVNASDPVQIDDLGQKPVLITLFEAQPKDKKQKEDKSTPIGQAALDLWPLLKNETQIPVTIPVYAIPGSYLETQGEQNQPSLKVNVSIDQPLVPVRDQSNTNAAYITLEGLYSPPEAWLAGGTTFVYTATLPIPINDDKEVTVVFTNGTLRAATDVTNKQKRWPDARGILTVNGTYILGQNINEESIDDEQGELRSKDDKEFRTNSEKTKPQVVWNIERRCFLLPYGSQSLQHQITRVPYLPVEIVRTATPTVPKGKKDEDTGISYHGVAYIETAPLLYPGATRLRGAYKIVPYNETEYKSKTKRSGNIIDEAMRIANQLFDRSSLNTSKKDAKLTVDKQAAAGAATSMAKKKTELGEESSSATTEAQQYIESSSYITIDIVLDRPIIEKRKLNELYRKISDLIPPRPSYPIKVNSAEKAVEDYQQQIKNVCSLILDEYRKVCVDDINTEATLPNDQKRRKLLYELNSTGKYFAFKEQLKHSVIKIVREKFLRTSKFDNPDELQTFISQLYVFLLDEMHRSLDKSLNIQEPESVPPSRNTDAQLRIFALEAESNGDYLLAAHYYKQRLAQNPDKLRPWLDFAAFHLLVNDLTKAEECLKECIAIEPTNSTVSILYAVLNAILENNEIADLFFETATTEDSENVIAWTLYAIFQKHIGNEKNAQITLGKAEKLQRAILKNEEEQGATAANITVTSPISDEKRAEEEEKERPIGEEKEDTGKSSDSQLNVASKSRLSRSSRSSKQKQEKSKSVVNEQISTRKSQDISSTIEVEKVASKKSIYLKSAEFLLKYNLATWAEKALAFEFLANTGKDHQVEITLAKAKILQQDFSSAETHITQALSIDYENVEAWALWGHVKYLQLDFEAAKGRYQRTLVFAEKPPDLHTVYIRLGAILLSEGNESSYSEAKEIFLRACRYQPTCTTYLGLGVACYRLNQYDDAEEALTEANFLNNQNAEVWGYLTLICLQTKRYIEAEQSYKYAIKLDLPAGPLLDEINAVQRQVGFGDPSF
ncbi:unnamed protein product [Rotaria sordida]|uniref:Cilia- and flagella-associated protein 70 n=3 Tax=Rotaria sordida TaxID=392033 RepID=A0A813VV22_9BILA|nr:unnamed protein product [Rotaria sordida]CAF0942433.1 unnamed protein product [Rotaria sordida]